MTANDLPTTPPATLRARGNEGLLAAAQAARREQLAASIAEAP